MPTAWSQKIRRFLLVFTLLALIAGSLHYVFNPRHLALYTEMELRLEKVRLMNRSLVLENRELVREIDACRSDPRYLQRHARRVLRTIREGQLVYAFGDTKKEP